jgi:hypothetical protein
MDEVLSCACAAAECAALAHAPVPSPPAPGPSSAAAAPASQVPLETFTHVFWGCPSVAQAVGWLWDLWTRIEGQPPPWDASVLLIGDPSEWRPSTRALNELWLRLRATFLLSVWRLRGRRAAGEGQFGPAAVVAMVAAAIESSMKADFHAATATGAAGVAGLSPAWFRGGGARESLESFAARWCVGGVLGRVVSDQQGSLAPRLEVGVPRALPGSWGAGQGVVGPHAAGEGGGPRARP